MKEEFKRTFEQDWEIKEKDKWCLALNDEILVLYAPDMKMANKIIEDYEIPDESVVVITGIEKVETVSYKNQLVNNPNFTLDDLAEYLLDEKMGIVLNRVDTYEPTEKNQKIQRVGTKTKMRIIQELETKPDEYSGYVKGYGKFMQNAYFRISEEDDENEMYVKTALFGCFGWHKFKKHEYLEGILYFLTAGFVSTATLIDLIFMSIGRYHFNQVSYTVDDEDNPISRTKEKIYMKKSKLPIVSKIGLMIVNIVISIILMFGVYPTITSTVNTVIENITNEKVQEAQNKLSNTSYLKEISTNFELEEFDYERK